MVTYLQKMGVCPEVKEQLSKEIKESEKSVK
jgi:hypothetical protein